MVYLKFFCGTPAKNWTPILEGRVMRILDLWTTCMRLDIHCSSSCSHDRSTLHRVPRSIAHTTPKLLGSHRLVFHYMYPHWPAYDYCPFVPTFLWAVFAFNILSFNTKGSPSITHSISTVVEHLEFGCNSGIYWPLYSVRRHYMKAYWGLEAWLDVVFTSTLDGSGFTVLWACSFPAGGGPLSERRPWL